MGGPGINNNAALPFYQANVSQAIENNRQSIDVDNANGFEQQLAPQILEEKFSQRSDLMPPAAVYQLLLFIPGAK